MMGSASPLEGWNVEKIPETDIGYFIEGELNCQENRIKTIYRNESTF
jgi:hypothetical protein